MSAASFTGGRAMARWLLPLLLLALVLGLWWWAGKGGESPGARSAAPVPSATAISTPRETPDSGLPTIAEGRLPAEAATTLRLIRAGGPYPYRADDGIFGNRERRLPERPKGYYREYTVVTPGAGDRGPRRIIAGAKGDLYWTTDHYAHFQQILEGR